MKHLPYITSVFFYLMLYSCANIVPPSGGEKDVDAPLMESQTPDNQSVNFIEDEIVIEFNEYIQYSSSSSSLVISPPMTVAPEINIKGKKLEIIFQEVLLPNTTYTLNFGDNVKDWNEGNAYRGLQYVFSTGNKLDSTSLQGRVLSAKEKEPIENVQVMLYEENTDSILVNSKPYYITQTNSSGMFSFTHLKAGIYQIAALSDKNFNYLYDQSTEQIAFLNQKIALTTSHELNEDLFLFAEKQDLKIEQEIVQKGYITFAFSEAIESITFDTEIYDEKDIAYLSKTNDTLHYWYNADVEQATFYMTLNETKKDTIILDLRQATEESFSIRNEKKELAVNEYFIIHFNSPLSAYDDTRILLKDSTNKNIPFSIKNDETNQLSIEAKWQERMIYSITCLDDAFTNYQGKTSEQKEISFTVVEEKSNGDLILTFVPQQENLILQLLDENKKWIEQVYIKDIDTYTFGDIEAGNYYIKVFHDENNNGQWDTGDFAKRQQPETIRFISTTIEMKTNWDKEIDINFE